MQKQKGISTLIGIIIIVAVAVVLFGGVFAYQYYTAKSEAQNPKSETNLNVQNPNVQNETAGWKTYKNEQAGIQFNYPKNWQIIYDRFDYQTAACQASNGGQGCGTKEAQIGLGIKQGEALLNINERQCLNLINLLKNNYICYDFSLPNGNLYFPKIVKINNLDVNIQGAINMIKNSFKISN